MKQFNKCMQVTVCCCTCRAIIRHVVFSLCLLYVVHVYHGFLLVALSFIMVLLIRFLADIIVWVVVALAALGSIGESGWRWGGG